jgi:uncharacterized protein YecE (DUF72 family)
MNLDHLHVGTSGWSYRHWRGAFYPADLPAKQHFAFYQEHFRTVELNTTFYHLPRPTTVDGWRRQASAGFIYAVKGSRYITHNKKLTDPEQHLDRFFDLIGELGPRLGPMLFQLPPSWSRNAQRLDAFLAAFRKRARRRAVAVEFRHPSWYHEEIYEILRHRHAALCISHLAGVQSPVMATAATVYLRLHGSGEKYAGAYGAEGLRPWVERISAWLADEREVFCYFDNDIGAAAPQDALLLQALVKKAASS